MTWIHKSRIRIASGGWFNSKNAVYFESKIEVDGEALRHGDTI